MRAVWAADGFDLLRKVLRAMAAPWVIVRNEAIQILRS
jgi:hypothetical protein